MRDGNKLHSLGLGQLLCEVESAFTFPDDVKEFIKNNVYSGDIDGVARSECERAARKGTFRAPPTAAPPKAAEATSGFSSNRKTIDIPPVRRYCSGQKKRWFKIPLLPALL